MDDVTRYRARIRPRGQAPRKLGSHGATCASSLLNGVLPQADDARSARGKVERLRHVARGEHVGGARPHEPVHDQAAVGVERAARHEIEVRLHALREHHLVEPLRFARAERDEQAAFHTRVGICGLGTTHRLPQAQLHAARDELFLEPLRHKRMRGGAQDMRATTEQRDPLPAVETCLEDLERDHGRSRYEHVAAPLGRKRVPQPHCIGHRAQNERRIPFDLRKSWSYRMRARRDEQLRIAQAITVFEHDLVRRNVERLDARMGAHVVDDMREVEVRPRVARIALDAAARVIRREDGAVGVNARIGDDRDPTGVSFRAQRARRIHGGGAEAEQHYRLGNKRCVQRIRPLPLLDVRIIP